jgi:hypothetical protein
MHETVRGGADRDGSRRTAQWTVGIRGAYGVCVSVHELPDLFFSPKGARDPQIKLGDVLSSSDPGAPPRDLEDACKLARFIHRDQQAVCLVVFDRLICSGCCPVLYGRIPAL